MKRRRNLASWNTFCVACEFFHLDPESKWVDQGGRGVPRQVPLPEGRGRPRAHAHPGGRLRPNRRSQGASWLRPDQGRGGGGRGGAPPNSERHEVLEALAKALETLDWELGAETLNPVLPKHHDKDVLETLHVVVPVLGKLGSASSVEPLIQLLQHAENEGKRVRAAGVRAAGNPKMLALEGPIRKSLQEITGGNEATADKWDDWWKANRERLLAGATVVYRCRATGKRWGQKTGESQRCPHHDKEEKDGIVVKTSLAGRKS